MATTSGVADQILSLPKGGGAIQGIGETFQPDLHTGTGNFSVPIAVPPGRNGFQPELKLSYSTGSGNGPFGLGWSLSIPNVSRKTSKGIPRYDDSDTYILSGAEDLVLVDERTVVPGRSWAWGRNDSGQVGDGTTTDRSLPGEIDLVREVVALAAGHAHVLALTADGAVWAWGANGDGQLGDGTTTNQSEPVQVIGLPSVVAVAAGGSHSLALAVDGTVWAWGLNDSGQLGDDTTAQRTRPLRVVALPHVIALAAGGRYSLALTANGTVWAWGDRGAGSVSNDPTTDYLIPRPVVGLPAITAIAAGATHRLALSGDGAVWTWGNNAFGQLGDGSTISRRQPAQIVGLPQMAAVAAGHAHSLAVTSAGEVWSWGNNDSGQLGDGGTTQRVTPIQIWSLPVVTTVAAGSAHTLARTANGALWAWGKNTCGQLGDGTTADRHAPVRIEGMLGRMTLAAGTDFSVAHAAARTVAMRRSGRVVGWGQGFAGMRRDDGTLFSPGPLDVEHLRTITAVAAGLDHSIALATDGTVWAWGSNTYGQLGSSAAGERTTPMPVAGLSDVMAVAAGGWHTLALKRDGTVWAWGRGNRGQIGVAMDANHAVPVQVHGIKAIIAVAAGQEHSLALTSEGQVWAWGQNLSGQLGIGTIDGHLEPVHVPHLDTIIGIAAGAFHSLAVREGGSVYAWGYNRRGQVGGGTNDNRLSPIQVDGLTNVRVLAAGREHSLALTTVGRVWTWGHTAADHGSQPVPVYLRATVTALAAGEHHSLALTDGGAVWGWGHNVDGELGDGTTLNRPTPVQVHDLTGVTAIAAGTWHSLAVRESDSATVLRDTERHRQYRPRTEGLFARIVHVTGNGKNHWEVTSKSGITSIYGKTEASRVSDAAAPSRIFQWLLSETEDTNHNRIVYSYTREHGAGLADRPYEQNHASNQVYLSTIRYVDDPALDRQAYRFSVTFDYGDARGQNGTWAYRPDPCSTYRAGFEIRTVRRCSQIVMRVHAPDGPAEGRMIKAYCFRYLDELTEHERNGESLPLNAVSLLAEVVLRGYRTNAQGHVAEASFPPLSFRYTRFEPDKRRYTTFGAFGGDVPDRALNHPEYEIVDLDGNGLPDIIHTASTGYRYWRNLGGCTFDRPRTMRRAPAGVTLADAGVQFADMDGNGAVDLLVTNGAMSGYYPASHETAWDDRSFRNYAVAPSFNLNDPNVKLVDMDGDGRTDLLQTGPTSLNIFYNRGKQGWDRRVQRVPRQQLDAFPDVAFSAPDQRVRLAAMSGELQDIVVIHGRRIDYWPNLGYGKWGKRITMRNAPELPRDYDPKRLFLTDLDGDGCADLVYIDLGRVTYWINQGGNAWSEAHVIHGTPVVSDADAIRIADMQGTGTAGILWTYDYTTHNRTNYKYLDPTGGIKPYVLSEMDNHLGAITHVSYAPSTRFYLDDRTQQPWLTRLPFPVQVVERVEVIDWFSRSKLVTCYAYHHGYWDGEEREFRGFGLVEQVDTETFDDHHGSSQYVPPTCTKTWFHVGKDVDYWPGVPASSVRALPSNLNAGATRQALRTLRGSVLRTELYALDGDERAGRSYTVTEHRYQVATIAALPPRDDAPDAPTHVFVPQRHATITRHSERGDETRTSHEITLYGDWGNVVKQIKIGEPRTPGDRSGLLTLITTNRYALDYGSGSYIKDRVAETRTIAPGDAHQRQIEQYLNTHTEPVWGTLGETSATRDEAPATLLGHVRHYYDGAAYQGRRLGELDRGNLTRSEALAFTPAMLQSIGITLAPEYHYVHDTAGSWVQTTRRQFGPYGLVTAMRDANGHTSTVAFDPHLLFPVLVTDPAGLQTRVAYDEQALAPRWMADPNDNEMEYAFDALGMLTAIAVKGKQVEGSWQGDPLAAPTTRFAYDLHSFTERGQPIHVHTLQREAHQGATFLESWEYFDGFGRSIQKKADAEPEQPGGPPRWVGSGWQVYNNKGWVVEKYEPFFTNTAAYEHEVKHGVHVTMHYDPLGRAVRTINPDGSFQQVVYGRLADLTQPDADLTQPDADLMQPNIVQPTPWEAAFYDENDTGAWRYDGGDTPIARPQAEIDALKIGGRSATADAPAEAIHLATPRREVYDAWGRTVATHEHNGIVEGSPQISITSSTYDLLGRLLTVTDAKGRAAFKHTYDLLGRLLRVEQIDAGTKTSVLDATGNPVESWDAKGAKVIRTYDVLNRPLTVKARDRDGQPITLRELYVYDCHPGADKVAARTGNTRGKPVYSYDGAGKLVCHAYDFKGNLLKKTRRVVKDTVGQAAWSESDDGARDHLLAPGNGYTVETAYDALNRITTLVYPDGTTLQHRYNDGNLLEKVMLGDTEYVKNIDYNAKGQRERIVYGNGVMTTYTYDPLTFRLHTLVTQKGREALQNLAYRYDLVGNILQVDDHARTRMENGRPYIANPRAYRYDPLYRLIAATGNERKGIDNFLPPDAPFHPTPDMTQYQAYERRYAYDAVSNIVAERSTRTTNLWTRSYSYVPGTNRLQQTSRGEGAPIERYRFDPAGNMTGMHTNWHYTWDYADRMIGAENRPQDAAPTMTAQYTYDAAGMRVMKVVRRGATTQTTIYIDGIFEAYTETRSGSVVKATQRKHVLDDASRIAIVKTTTVATERDDEPAILYQHGDHLGSSQVVTQADGSFYNQEEYYPYGETSFGSYARKRYRFTGKERDEESGLYYHAARYYAPWLGRWMSCDPAGMVDGVNLYAYTRQNPLRFVDPSGLAPMNAGTSGAAAAPDAGVVHSVAPPPAPTPTHLNLEMQEHTSADGSPSGRTVKIKDFDSLYVPYEGNCYSAASETVSKASKEGLIAGAYRSKPSDPKSAAVYPRLTTFDGIADKRQTNIISDPTKAKQALEYIVETVDSGLPAMVGVNEGGIAQTINEGVTDHFLVVYGYELALVEGTWKVTKLYGLDNAVGDYAGNKALEAAAHPVFDVGSDYKMTKSGKPPTDADYAYQLSYQITQVRFYKKDFDMVKNLNAYFGPTALKRK